MQTDGGYIGERFAAGMTAAGGRGESKKYSAYRFQNNAILYSKFRTVNGLRPVLTEAAEMNPVAVQFNEAFWACKLVCIFKNEFCKGLQKAWCEDLVMLNYTGAIFLRNKSASAMAVRFRGNPVCC